jgi:hypothetical protein
MPVTANLRMLIYDRRSSLEMRATRTWRRAWTRAASDVGIVWYTVSMSLVDEARAIRQRVAARLRELEPLVREYNELKEVAAELRLDESEPGPTLLEADLAPEPEPQPARSAPPPPSHVSELAQRVLEAVAGEPGQTVAEYAVILDMAPTSLYRPVRELTNSGVLVKRTRQLFPA